MRQFSLLYGHLQKFVDVHVVHEDLANSVIILIDLRVHSMYLKCFYFILVQGILGLIEDTKFFDRLCARLWKIVEDCGIILVLL